MTIIISGFPGIGKTYCHERGDFKTLDSDSSKFSWLESGVRDPEFPGNYIEHIEANAEKVDMIFVSSHKVVRDALVDGGLIFLLVFPDPSLKAEYIQRYKDRGNAEAFVKLLEDNWESWMDELVNQEGCVLIKLKSGKFLSDYFGNIEGYGLEA